MLTFFCLFLFILHSNYSFAPTPMLTFLARDKGSHYNCSYTKAAQSEGTGDRKGGRFVFKVRDYYPQRDLHQAVRI